MKPGLRFSIRTLLIVVVAMLVSERYTDIFLIAGFLGYFAGFIALMSLYNLIYLVDFLVAFFWHSKIRAMNVELKKVIPFSKKFSTLFPFQWCFYILHESGRYRCVRILTILRQRNNHKRLLLYYSIYENKVKALDQFVFLVRIGVVIISDLLLNYWIC